MEESVEKALSGAPRVSLATLGCKLNQAESEALADLFVRAGCRLVPPEAGPDIYVLNTCTVTHVADRKSRHLLRAARRRNPSVRVVATGCYAERAPGDLERMEGVDLIVGNERKMGLVRLLEESGWLKSGPRPAPAGHPGVGSRTRAFVRVQDGCSNACAYCIVPLVRRGERSVPVGIVIDTVREKVRAGYQEVVLTGTEIGSYRHDGVDIKGLIESILRGTDVPRLRISSLQPPEVSPALVALWGDERLCPHFHLSLQSGSDAVLRRMRRRYTRSDFREAVSLVGETLPEASVTTDVIVGFPGENEREFEDTLDFCGQMEFARIHVFPYSSRPGTEAAAMPDIVPARVKLERARRMLALARESAGRFRQRFAGRSLPVLWEQEEGGVWSGYTGNYIRVYSRSVRDLANRVTAATLVAPERDGLRGEIP